MSEPAPAKISLAIPGRPEYGRVARVGAAHLAHRRGFTLGEIDDLRMAIDEAVIMLLGPSPRAGRIEVAYRVTSTMVEVTMISRLDGDHTPLPTERTQRFHDLTDELTDEVHVEATERRVRVVKRHTASAG